MALLNRKPESEKAFRAAIRLDEAFAEPRFNLGKLLLEAGRSLEAKEQLQTAVALNPDHLPSIELLLDSMLATRDESSAVTLLGSLHRRHVSHPAQ